MRSIIQTGDGGYAFIADSYIYKVDSNGNEQWNKKFQFTLWAVIQSSDNGYVLIGDFCRDAGSHVIKLDSAGNIVWDNVYGSKFNYFAFYNIVPTGSGYLICGSALMKIDLNGTLLWVKPFAPNITFYYIIQASDEGFLLAMKNGLTLKTDADGNPQWTYKYPQNSNGVATTFLANDGGYLIVTPTLNEPTMQLVKLSAGGTFEWAKGITNNLSGSVISVSDGGYAFVSNELGELGNNLYLTKLSSVYINQKTQTLQPLEPLQVQWEHTYSREGWGYFVTDIVEAFNGGYITSGYMGQWEPYHGHGGGNRWVNTSAFLIKTDAKGVLQWEKTYNLQTITFLIRAVDGYLFTDGHVFCKIDASGNVQWSKEYAFNIFHSACSLSAGGFLLLGTGSIDAGGSSGKIVKLGSDGNVQWSKFYGSSDFPQTFYSVIEVDSGFLLCGNQDVSGDNTYGLITKTDSQGNILWTKNYANAVTLNHVFSSSDGGFVLFGLSGSSYYAEGSGYVLKVDSNGDAQWTQNYGEDTVIASGGIRLYSPIKTADEQFLTLVSVTNRQNEGTPYYLTMEITGSGEISLIKNNLYLPTGIAILSSDGNYLFAGPKSTSDRNQAAIWLAKVGLSVDVDNSTPSEPQPSPISNNDLMLIFAVILVLVVVIIFGMFVRMSRNNLKNSGVIEG
jgi:photosystem II stability/assembly factor-like uncharacterized protein